MDLTKNRFFLMFTAFAAGVCIMSLELTASRVLAPAFGSSIYVWGSLIGVIMASLAAGYYLGGWVADRRGDIRVLYKFLLLSAVLTSFIPIFGKPVVELSSIAGLIYGPIISTLALFSIPMTLMAVTSPMVIKFSTDRISELGLSSGKIYAVSTVGSIFGTFATAFFLIPAIGSKGTILATSAAVFVLGLLGLMRWEGVLLLVFLAPGFLIQPPLDAGVIYSTESEYNIIKVLDSPEQRQLKLNYDYIVHSAVKKGELMTGGYWDFFSLGPLLTKTDRIIWLGMCAGTSPMQLAHFYNASVDAVEIDPGIVEVGRRFFNLKESEKVRVHISDGRMFLKSSGSYDVVNVDVISNGIDVPFHMATKEFFSEASSHMTDDGVLLMNSIAAGNDESVSNGLANTMKQVFPSVYVIKMGKTGSGRMLVAFKKSKSLKEVKTSLKGYDPDLRAVVEHTLSNIAEYSAADGAAFTDDKSNIDELTFNMFTENTPAHFVR